MLHKLRVIKRLKAYIKSLFHSYQPIVLESRLTNDDSWNGVYDLIHALGGGLEYESENADDGNDDEENGITYESE